MFRRLKYAAGLFVSLATLVLVLNEVFPKPNDFAAPVEPVYYVEADPIAVVVLAVGVAIVGVSLARAG